MATAQEICDNGIDDDMDGIIDLQDTVDCDCISDFKEMKTKSLIRNHSFEEMDPLYSKHKKQKTYFKHPLGIQ